MTNDLFLTLDLLKTLPELRLTADLSHYVVSREFPYPLRDDNHADFRAILDRSHAFHRAGGRTRSDPASHQLFPIISRGWTYFWAGGNMASAVG